MPQQWYELGVPELRPESPDLEEAERQLLTSFGVPTGPTTESLIRGIYAPVQEDPERENQRRLLTQLQAELFKTPEELAEEKYQRYLEGKWGIKPGTRLPWWKQALLAVFEGLSTPPGQPPARQRFLQEALAEVRTRNPQLAQMYQAELSHSRALEQVEQRERAALAQGILKSRELARKEQELLQKQKQFEQRQQQEQELAEVKNRLSDRGLDIKEKAAYLRYLAATKPKTLEAVLTERLLSRDASEEEILEILRTIRESRMSQVTPMIVRYETPTYDPQTGFVGSQMNVAVLDRATGEPKAVHGFPTVGGPGGVPVTKDQAKIIESLTGSKQQTIAGISALLSGKPSAYTGLLGGMSLARALRSTLNIPTEKSLDEGLRDIAVSNARALHAIGLIRSGRPAYAFIQELGKALGTTPITTWESAVNSLIANYILVELGILHASRQIPHRVLEDPSFFKFIKDRYRTWRIRAGLLMERGRHGQIPPMPDLKALVEEYNTKKNASKRLEDVKAILERE